MWGLGPWPLDDNWIPSVPQFVLVGLRFVLFLHCSPCRAFDSSVLEVRGQQQQTTTTATTTITTATTTTTSTTSQVKPPKQGSPVPSGGRVGDAVAS